jgi:glyoxylase-like metal-dependent hydrolase (beta-lactamase superfamily II)
MSQPLFASCQMGDFQVTALSDGNMTASLTLLLGIDASDAWAIQREAGVTEPETIHIQGYLIRGRGRTILVDSGTGGGGGVGGLLSASLAACGVSPQDVDTVLLTHAHPDHIGGLLDAQGKAVFNNAQLYVHPLEVAYWQDDEKMRQVIERRQRNFLLARRVLAVYGQRLNALSEDDIIAGIAPVWLPGHTPGHTGFRIDAGDKRLLIWGDIVHFPHIQSVKPGTSVEFDCDPVQAEVTRKTIMAQASQQQWVIAGMHLGRPGFARLIAKNEGYCLEYTDA